jgi:short-subunit dehydrogenase
MNQSVLLTGHTKGVGNALLKKLLLANCRVTGIARSVIAEPSGELIQLQADLSDSNALIKVAAQLKQASFNALVLNAGWNDIRPAEAYSVEEIIKIITLNLTAHAALIRACLPSLIQNKGVIIAVGSYAGIEVEKWNNYYGAAKAGLHHLQQNLFEQYRKQGLKVTTIIPDITLSSFYEHQQFAPANDKDSFIDADEIAGLISELLLNPPNYVPTQVVVRPQRFELTRKKK